MAASVLGSLISGVRILGICGMPRQMVSARLLAFFLHIVRLRVAFIATRVSAVISCKVVLVDVFFHLGVGFVDLHV